jgi:hypothetical protein
MRESNGGLSEGDKSIERQDQGAHLQKAASANRFELCSK